jgi:hypothetical protein
MWRWVLHFIPRLTQPRSKKEGVDKRAFQKYFQDLDRSSVGLRRIGWTNGGLFAPTRVIPPITAVPSIPSRGVAGSAKVAIMSSLNERSIAILWVQSVDA